MSRAGWWMVVALAAAPAIAYWIYRLAKALGFLEPPRDEQHELRRTIIAALYAFLLFLPVLLYGFERGWPRAWVLFGIVNGIALVFFAAGGIWAAVRLWKLRFPEESFGAGEALNVTRVAEEKARTASNANERS